MAYTALIRSRLKYCSSLCSSVAKTSQKAWRYPEKSSSYYIPSTFWYAEPLLVLLYLWCYQQQKRGALPTLHKTD